MGLAEDVEALGVLAEPQRLRVYQHLANGGAASLTEIAATLDMGRTLAAFHLGKLVEVGLVEQMPPTVVTGRPGRPSQRYRVSREEISASVPSRHYEWVAEVLLVAAAEQQPGEPLAAAAAAVARRQGAVVAAGHRPGRAARTAKARLTLVAGLLGDLGYAPREHSGELVLLNCPFDRLRATNCELVCGINQALAEGYLDALGLDDSLAATMRPCDGACCVVIEARQA